MPHYDVANFVATETTLQMAIYLTHGFVQKVFPSTTTDRERENRHGRNIVRPGINVDTLVSETMHLTAESFHLSSRH